MVETTIRQDWFETMTKPQVLPPKPNALAALFPVQKPIIGVIHLLPLPGAPRYAGQPVREVYAAAVRDAKTLSEGGVDQCQQRRSQQH